MLTAASIKLQHAFGLEGIDPGGVAFALAKYQTAALAILTTFRDDFVAHNQAECASYLPTFACSRPID